MNAAARRYEREGERQYKAQLKAEMAAEAEEAVAIWEDHIDRLKSLHHEVSTTFDWNKIAAAAPPDKPEPVVSSTLCAKEELDAFKPRFTDRLRIGGSDRRKQKLFDALERAKEEDRERHRKRLREYQAAHDEWKADKLVAEQLLAGDIETILAVINENQSLSESGLIGSEIKFHINTETGVHAILATHGTDVVPDFRRKQLASGKLSETKMPRGEFNDIYQDYVASASFRVAGELFSILPLDTAYVTCTTEMLNSASGHLEPTPILSVQFVRETFDRLNLRQIDPSDALSNFNHKMGFKRTTGFSRIEPLVAL